jgi:hypothetical protein
LASRKLHDGRLSLDSWMFPPGDEVRSAVPMESTRNHENSFLWPPWVVWEGPVFNNSCLRPPPAR